jgi:hypothetical protein
MITGDSKNGGDHWSNNNYSLDTFSNSAWISTVAVQFCAGSRGARGVLYHRNRECETSVLSASEILRHLHIYPTAGKYDVEEANLKAVLAKAQTEQEVQVEAIAGFTIYGNSAITNRSCSHS